MLMCVICIPFAWVTYLFTLPWVIASVHWSPILAFFFLPLWVSTAATLWRRYRRYRTNRTIADDEAVIGLLDADEVLEDGLDLYAVGYKDGEEFGLRKLKGFETVVLVARYMLIDHMFDLCTTSYKRKTKHFGAYIKMKACKVGSVIVL